MMPTTVRVEVTAEDIANGVATATDSCPVALAMTRTLGVLIFASRGRRNGRWVGVGWLPLGAGVEFRLSAAVGQFMYRFDHDKPVEPFAFRVWR